MSDSSKFEHLLPTKLQELAATCGQPSRTPFPRHSSHFSSKALLIALLNETQCMLVCCRPANSLHRKYQNLLGEYKTVKLVQKGSSGEATLYLEANDEEKWTMLPLLGCSLPYIIEFSFASCSRLCQLLVVGCFHLLYCLHTPRLQAQTPIPGGERFTKAGNPRKHPKTLLHDSMDIYRLMEEIKGSDVDIDPAAVTSVGESCMVLGVVLSML